MRWDVIVIGAGAAGLMAAIRAAERGKHTLLLEKNARPGVKILMSGGTRCNITHDTDRRGIIDAYGKPGKFLYSALSALGPRELIAFFEAEGVATKIEDTGKIFPVSDRAADVLEALLKRLRRSGAELTTGQPAQHVSRDESGFSILTPLGTLSAEKLIITTGGQSYPGSGTRGDGYPWAKDFGHTIVAPVPALAPLTSNAPWVAELKGITIPDVEVRVVEGPVDRLMAGAVDLHTANDRPIVLASRRASFLFAHFGLSGPAPMDVSRVVSRHPRPSTLTLIVDLLPAVKEEKLSALLKSECESSGKRHLENVVSMFVPNRVACVLLALLKLSGTIRAAELSKRDMARIVSIMKRLPIPLSGTMGFGKAEVTSGGVDLGEVNSSTLESKLVPGLYFAGEILDLDGPIGGFNFQAAFSTGWLAGQSV